MTLNNNKIKKEVLKVLREILGDSFFAPSELQDLASELTSLTDQLLNADTSGEKEITAAKIMSKRDDFEAALEALNGYISSLPSDSGARSQEPPQEPDEGKERWSDEDKRRGYQLEPWMEIKRSIKDMILQEVYLILNGTDPEDTFLRENDPAGPQQERQGFAATAAEEAAIINQQVNAQGPDEYGMVMALSTDQAHWEKLGVRTGEDLAKTMLVQTYSDLYKEFHGRRPRGHGLWELPVDEINQAVIDLENQMQASWQEEEAQQKQASEEAEEEARKKADQATHPHDEYDELPMQTSMGRRGE